jgi:hypothetical protein
MNHQVSTTSGALHRVEPRTQAACMEACAACALACNACADGCLMEREIAAFRRCIQLDLDCAAICGAMASLLARGSDFDPRIWRAQLEACARVCAACDAECLRHADHHPHCRVCAEACRVCAERCGALLRELPDAHGETHVRSGQGEEHPATRWPAPSAREH